MAQHEIIVYPKRILFPLVRPKNADAIERAVAKVVKPSASYCYCGKNCAINRKHVAMLKKQASHRS